MGQSRTNVSRVTRLVKAGKISRSEAAELLKTTIRTIHNYVKKYEKQGLEGLVDHRGGTYCKLSPETIQQIITCKAQRPQRSARWIRDWLKLDVSVEAIRQVLVKNNATFDTHTRSRKTAKTEFNRPQLITPEEATMINPDSVVKISNDVIVQELDGEAVLLNMNSEIYFGLDKIGTRIWNLLQTQEHVGSVARTLLEEYDIGEEDLNSHLFEFIEKLDSKGLITIQKS